MQATKWVFIGLIILILAGMTVKEARRSQIMGQGQYRFNLAMVVPDQGSTFVSFDPTEKNILALPFPTEMAIKSRGSGEYSMSSLYKLGSYKGSGGKFARQKIQGFMRVPVPGYLVVGSRKGEIKTQLRLGLLKVLLAKSESNLSRFDAVTLLFRMSNFSWREVNESELVRAGVVDKNIYHPERLQEYVGSRLFDWRIGGDEITVAIVNMSGENGLGSDLADFLSNLGLDVVMVRSLAQDQELETSEWQVESDETAKKLGYIFENLFGLREPKIEAVTGEYRSTVLIKVGKDAKELF